MDKKHNRMTFRQREVVAELPTSHGTLYIEKKSGFKGSLYQATGLLWQMDLDHLSEGLNLLVSRNGGFSVYGEKYVDEDGKAYFQIWNTACHSKRPAMGGNVLVAAI